MRLLSRTAFAVVIALCAIPLRAQERPYFSTYDHYLEEPGALEIGVAALAGRPRAGRSYASPLLELEYGVTGWWTTELYLEAVARRAEGNAFTGWRWENRFRLLPDEHRLNPVLYLEYEHVSEASALQKDVVGSGSHAADPLRVLRAERMKELEAKLILSGTFGGWNLSQNLVAEKNLTENEGVEFGYAVGLSRALGALAQPTRCRLCRENFVVGVEAFGGLGGSGSFGLYQTRHYIAPVMSWRASPEMTVNASLGVGLSKVSDKVLVRLGTSWEWATPWGAR